jgi:hypothetical protein
MPLPDRRSVLTASHLMAVAAFGGLATPHTEAVLTACLQIECRDCAVNRGTHPAAHACGRITVYLADGRGRPA